MNPSTIIIEPQRFESAEVGAKWNINPKLLFTAATYQLLRANVLINVGNGVFNKYQFNPTWAAALGVIYFSDSFASSDDTVRLPGFVGFDAAVYASIDDMWRVQLNVENIFNRAMGDRRRQQQHLAGPAPHGAPDRDRKVLSRSRQESLFSQYQ